MHPAQARFDNIGQLRVFIRSSSIAAANVGLQGQAGQLDGIVISSLSAAARAVFP
jgi:hypothetical protein